MRGAVVAAMLYASPAAAACADLPPLALTSLPKGWFVHIEPGEHPQVVSEPLLVFIPYGDARLRYTPVRHHVRACVSGGHLTRLYTFSKLT